VLSNTIFGVAMTLLAYNLPKGQIPQKMKKMPPIKKETPSELPPATRWDRRPTLDTKRPKS
jgi:hypothetical protein